MPGCVMYMPSEAWPAVLTVAEIGVKPSGSEDQHVRPEHRSEVLDQLAAVVADDSAEEDRVARPTP